MTVRSGSDAAISAEGNTGQYRSGYPGLKAVLGVGRSLPRRGTASKSRPSTPQLQGGSAIALCLSFLCHICPGPLAPCPSHVHAEPHRRTFGGTGSGHDRKPCVCARAVRAGWCVCPSWPWLCGPLCCFLPSAVGRDVSTRRALWCGRRRSAVGGRGRGRGVLRGAQGASRRALCRLHVATASAVSRRGGGRWHHTPQNR